MSSRWHRLLGGGGGGTTAPSLEAWFVTFPPSTIHRGSSFSFKVAVKNTGSSSVSAPITSWFVHNGSREPPTVSKTVNLSPGQTKYLTFTTSTNAPVGSVSDIQITAYGTSKKLKFLVSTPVTLAKKKVSLLPLNYFAKSSNVSSNYSSSPTATVLWGITNDNPVKVTATFKDVVNGNLRKTPSIPVSAKNTTIYPQKYTSANLKQSEVLDVNMCVYPVSVKKA